MTLSGFLQMLYPLIGKGQQTHEFVIYITDHIMEDPVTEHDKQNVDNDTYNPLAKKGDSMLQKIYSGAREISTRDAGAILAHLDIAQFQDFLSDFSSDVIVLIGNVLKYNEVVVIDKKIVETCTSLLVSILYDCANRVSGNKKFQPALLDNVKDTIQNEIEQMVIKNQSIPDSSIAEENYFIAGNNKNVFQNETHYKRMKEIFEQAIEDYEIADYILGNYWDYSAYTVF